jgi:hypothetical protein
MLDVLASAGPFACAHAAGMVLVQASLSNALHCRHVFLSGFIKPTICLGYKHLCEGPSAPLIPFTVSLQTRLGAPLSSAEHHASLQASHLILSSQFPAKGCTGKQQLLVYCYVNPGLAGHGAQVSACMRDFKQLSQSERREANLAFMCVSMIVVQKCFYNRRILSPNCHKASCSAL